jgi:hypothetical protein
MNGKFSPGDLVLVDRPTQFWGPGDPVLGATENMHLGIVVDYDCLDLGPGPFNGLRWVRVQLEGENITIPEQWCRRVRAR